MGSSVFSILLSDSLNW